MKPDESSSKPSFNFPHFELRDIFNILQKEDEIPWSYFRDGVDIYRFYGDGITGPTAALIRFRKEARVPMHLHEGWEHILVLAGSQRDQNGTIHAGTLRIHPPGTYHSVVSEAGCIVLAIYEKPVRFMEKPHAPAELPDAE
ncbi:ChrR Cupin-like domain-containing protein [Prosthecobacter debontii]|uniref:ChrR Cupin-like domain-containing protein n=1 Tax=Prosthecobacter debontii TaxID=48467 RepID=A0A1T4YCY2_9BACT|nr:cupin domain-containing protein [Prosthecobacter debontii]SKA99624.1 ChrR Cupin-like domain-containing protein [Prosthecobacter debontii]